GGLRAGHRQHSDGGAAGARPAQAETGTNASVARRGGRGGPRRAVAGRLRTAQRTRAGRSPRRGGRARVTTVDAMQMRTLGRTGRKVSVIGLGAWQLGEAWGTVTAQDAHEVLDAAVATGVTMIDTADAYGDGRSERFIGELLARSAGRDLFVATKMGRRVEQRPENYNADNFRAWTDRSRSYLGVDSLDLVQLHCPPSPVYADDAVFDALDGLVAAGAIRAYGVSVETCAEALAAIRRPGVATVQIILNCFRQKPLDEVLPAATEAGVGIIARVPLASGLLSGKYDETTTF